METETAIEKMKAQNAKLRAELAELNQAFEEAYKKHKSMELRKARVPPQSEQIQNGQEREIRKIYA
jgi:hypothetical protein